MAISIRALARPTIRLRGSNINGNDIDEIITYDTLVSGNTVRSGSYSDHSRLLVFNKQVQIIITGQQNPKPTFVRESGILPELVFEGGKRWDTLASNSSSLNNSSEYAHTFYSLINKDPRRTANYVYKFTDLDDRVDDNPSTGALDNINDLGFVLKYSNTGNNSYTLRAKTKYQGKVSPVTEVSFRIYQPPSENNIIRNIESNI